MLQKRNSVSVLPQPIAHTAKRILKLGYRRVTQDFCKRASALKTLLVLSVVAKKACQIIRCDQRPGLLFQDVFVLVDSSFILFGFLKNARQRVVQDHAIGSYLKS